MWQRERVIEMASDMFLRTKSLHPISQPLKMVILLTFSTISVRVRVW